jgi:Domain of unknown function (DUF3291)
LSARFQLAQVNIASPLEPLDSPLLAEFVEQLGPVNATAELSDGFVWRLQTESGNATDVRGFDDERLIINMSVWESLDSLRAFVYSTRAHLDVMRRRRDWFARLRLGLALWWVPTGHRPTIAEAEERFALLQARGPSPDAFTFREHYPAPDLAQRDPMLDDRQLCPAG